MSAADFDSTLLLRGRGFRKEYGSADGLVRAVDDLDVDVAAGETLAIMGPSGCGKSTLLICWEAWTARLAVRSGWPTAGSTR